MSADKTALVASYEVRVRQAHQEYRDAKLRIELEHREAVRKIAADHRAAVAALQEQALSA